MLWSAETHNKRLQNDRKSAVRFCALPLVGGGRPGVAAGAALAVAASFERSRSNGPTQGCYRAIRHWARGGHGFRSAAPATCADLHVSW